MNVLYNSGQWQKGVQGRFGFITCYGMCFLLLITILRHKLRLVDLFVIKNKEEKFLNFSPLFCKRMEFCV